jgi:hypothetical protein
MAKTTRKAVGGSPPKCLAVTMGKTADGMAACKISRLP